MSPSAPARAAPPPTTTATAPIADGVVASEPAPEPTTETTVAEEPAPAGETLTIGSRPLRLDQVDTAPGRSGTPLAILVVAALIAVVAALALANHFGWLGSPLLAPSRSRPATAGATAFAGGLAVGEPATEDVPAGGADPRADRMAARLVALLALSQRAQFERQGRPLPATWDAVVDWVANAGAGPGLQPHEQAILRRPTGTLDEAEVAMASWQVEGAVVVTWALGLLDELPPIDEAVDPVLVSAAVGFPDGARTLEVLQSARPRSPAEIDAEVDRHELILGSLQEEPAVAGRPVSGRDPEAIDVVRGIATERLRALHWLRGVGRRPAVAIDG